MAAPSSPLRVFIVENHADTRLWLGLYLEEFGYQVESAASMQEALAAIPAANCHVLISDIGLPDGDGWQLLRTLREQHAAIPPFTIAMSGFGLNSDRLKSQAAGYRHHILKPFNPDELDAMLEEAVRELAA